MLHGQHSNIQITMTIAQEALAAAQGLPLESLIRAAAELRDAGHRHITFSPKVFIPLTRLCRDRWVQPEGSLGTSFCGREVHLSRGVVGQHRWTVCRCLMGACPVGTCAVFAACLPVAHLSSSSCPASQLWLLHVCHAACAGAASVHDSG